mgnify:CR=1 FL=1
MSDGNDPRQYDGHERKARGDGTFTLAQAPQFTPRLQKAYEAVLKLKGETLRLEVSYGEAQNTFRRIEQELVAARGREHKAFEHFSREHANELRRKGL